MRIDKMKDMEFPFWAVKEHRGDYEVVRFSKALDLNGIGLCYDKKLNLFRGTIEDVNPGMGYYFKKASLATRYHTADSLKGNKYIKEIIKKIFI